MGRSGDIEDFLTARRKTRGEVKGVGGGVTVPGLQFPERSASLAERGNMRVLCPFWQMMYEICSHRHFSLLPVEEFAIPDPPPSRDPGQGQSAWGKIAVSVGDAYSKVNRGRQANFSGQDRSECVECLFKNPNENSGRRKQACWGSLSQSKRKGGGGGAPGGCSPHWKRPPARGRRR